MKQPAWIEALPVSKRPKYYVSECARVNEFAELCSKHIPYETGIWTSSLEYFWEQLVSYLGEEDAWETMLACLQKAVDNPRFVPGRDNKSRYLYRVIQVQVQHLQGRI